MGFRQQRPQRPSGLFDLHGIGFSRQGEECKVPQVPKVTIKVDGHTLRLPDTPIRFTNDNGYSEQNRYQVYGPMNDHSKIEASADNPDVKFFISRAVGGRATITATYQGNTKIYLIN